MIRAGADHHVLLTDIQNYYASKYKQQVPVTWLVFQALDLYLADPKNRAPQVPFLDQMELSAPGLYKFKNLEQFMFRTEDRVASELLIEKMILKEKPDA